MREFKKYVEAMRKNTEAVQPNFRITIYTCGFS